MADSGDPPADAGAAGVPAVLAPDTIPCAVPEAWPFLVESARYPAVVHYRAPDEAAVAAQVLQHLEQAWQVEVDALGFSPPVADGGRCGPDARFDTFVWRGVEESYAFGLEPALATPHEDRVTFLVVDPWGPFGGERLDVTVAHELNHALQGADDWWESPLVFEMTATFVEEVVFDDDDGYRESLVDFQARPDWSLDRNDDWQTWYMYGASLYLMFLREHVFGGDASFVARMWRGSRNPPGPNEPDFVDALDAILRQAGSTFVDSVATFARWRWYTGVHDDGRHFEEGAHFPPVHVAQSSPVLAGQSLALDPEPMGLGSAYVELRGAADQQVRLRIDDDSGGAVRWSAAALPQRPDDPADLTSGEVTVTLSADGERVIVLTALPAAEHDPDLRDDTRYGATLHIVR